MKTIFWVIMLTTTTWYDGHPYTKQIGHYETLEKCEKIKDNLLQSYQENFPDGSVHVVEIYCSERKENK